MRHIFIVNPVSGKADASGTLVPRIITAAKGLEAEYEVQLTEYPGHAVQLARPGAAVRLRGRRNPERGPDGRQGE